MNEEEEVLSRKVYRQLWRVCERAENSNAKSYINLKNITGHEWKDEERLSEANEGLLNNMLTVIFNIDETLLNALKRLEKLNEETRYWKKKK